MNAGKPMQEVGGRAGDDDDKCRGRAGVMAGRGGVSDAPAGVRMFDCLGSSN